MTREDEASPVPVRTEILEKAKKITAEDRNRQYGNPEDNFQTIADLWNAYWQARCAAMGVPFVAIAPYEVAVFCDCIKTARIATSPEVKDHWVDKAGYAACGGECATKPEGGNE